MKKPISSATNDASADVSAIQTKRTSVRRFGRSALKIALIVGIFWLGLNIGNGTIAVSGVYRSVTTNQSLPADLDYAEVERLYDILREQYDGELTEAELIDGLKKGLITATGDTYTEYMNPEEAAEFGEQLSGTFSGIGAELGKDEDGNLTIIAPISGFPADKAGLRAKDVIITINDESASGLTVSEAVTKIRGEKGTEVTLEVIRGGSERKTITIVRDTITVPSVEHEIKDGIGYITINQFWNDTAELTRQAAREFKTANVRGVVLDLRGNPGGSLDAAVEVSSVWLPSGKTILQEKRDGQVTETFTASGSPLLLGMPTQVLIDEGSASASEIVAGALKDNDVAVLVGTQSYGKGSVQRIIDLNNGGQLKVTIARWYRPNGDNIDKKGITPDTIVEMTEEDYTSGADPQLDAAVSALR